MRTLLAPPICCAALLVALVFPVRAQVITGRVVNSVDGTAVGAGFVVLLDQSGRVLLRALSRADGSFSITVPTNAETPLRLRSERIGFQAETSEPIVPVDGDTPEVILRVRPLATSLATIEVVRSSECDIRTSRSSAASVAWGEARKALEAAAWTETQPFQLLSNVYERDVDPRRNEVLSVRHRLASGFSRPFRARDPAALVQSGYVVETDEGAVYYAPDAQAIQHPTFLDTHCFQMIEADGLIGLTFEPVPSQRLPDVKGTLWIDRATAQLRFLEYEYTGVSQRFGVREPGKGRLDFMALPSGAWIVKSWEIEIPTSVQRRSADRGNAMAMVTVQSVRRSGGEVMHIADPSGVRIYEAQMASVTGVVIDSLMDVGRRLANATVLFDATEFEARSDNQGRFRLAVPLSGRHDVTFTHPMLDSLGFSANRTPVTLARGQESAINLNADMATLTRSLNTICTPEQRTHGDRLLLGTVLDSARRQAQPRMEVVASWQRADGDGSTYSTVQVTTTTDSTGRYALCGLASDRNILIHTVNLTGRMSHPQAISFDSTGVRLGRQHFATRFPVWTYDPAVVMRYDARNALIGAVTNGRTGAPIDSATVRVPGSSNPTLTDANGVFVVPSALADGTELAVERAGYRTQFNRVGERPAANGPNIVSGDLLALLPVATLTGLVQDTSGMRLRNANVILESSTGEPVVQSFTDSLGRFSLSTPISGQYRVMARAIGYGRVTMGPVLLTEGMNSPVTINLVETNAFSLDPIEVTGEAADQYLTTVGFYRRQIANNGYFLGPEEIEKRLGTARDVADLIGNLPGVHTGSDAAGSFGAPISVTRNSWASSCTEPLIFLDGIRLDPMNLLSGSPEGPAPQFLTLNTAVQPEDVYAIEIFRTPSQIPAQYSGRESGCGVILIWTR